MPNPADYTMEGGMLDPFPVMTDPFPSAGGGPYTDVSGGGDQGGSGGDGGSTGGDGGGTVEGGTLPPYVVSEPPGGPSPDVQDAGMLPPFYVTDSPITLPGADTPQVPPADPHLTANPPPSNQPPPPLPLPGPIADMFGDEGSPPPGQFPLTDQPPRDTSSAPGSGSGGSGGSAGAGNLSPAGGTPVPLTHYIPPGLPAGWTDQLKNYLRNSSTVRSASSIPSTSASGSASDLTFWLLVALIIAGLTYNRQPRRSHGRR